MADDDWPDNTNMTKPSVSLPGFSAPAAGFDQPFEMLTACHQRVLRSIGLLHRLRQHVAQHGHDANSRSAAADILRYFDIAGPLHHEDEELHLFPALRTHPNAQVRAAVAQLQDEHRQMHATWTQLRTLLLHWRDDAQPPAPSAAGDTLITAFSTAYQRHIDLEETLAYPAAQAMLAPATLSSMGAEMSARRRTDARR